MEATVAGMLSNPLLTRWWKSGVTPFTPSFRETVDKAKMKLGGGVWKYTPLAEL